ncbi:hypothetical protein [Kutzneria albida]|uniref:hypothetical protein n=1 Tax=Kutzneria albida TaxID=43357 RepID=UPI001F255CBB|nr:hypothetical protein [Kutzneria albida]
MTVPDSNAATTRNRSTSRSAGDRRRASSTSITSEQHTGKRSLSTQYLFLGDHRRAQKVLEKTARGIRRQNKSRAIVLGNLSLAHLRQGELDAATAALHEAIDVVEETRGGGGLNIVFDAGKELRRWRSEQLVSEVYDRLLSLMTAA